MLERSQRLQQQAVQQHQAQHPQQLVPNLPQYPEQPSAGGPSMKALFDNFPRLLEMKRLGQLKPTQEQAVSKQSVARLMTV
jgi:hypothetical protein